jgi:hypothetical protein
MGEMGDRVMGTLQLNIVVGIALAICSISPASAQADKSSPRDRNQITRPAIPGDKAGPIVSALKAQAPLAGQTATIIRNVDIPFAGSETSIAVNPVNPNEIVISAFISSFSPNAAVLHSTDGGQTWTRVFSIPAPPGVPAAQTQNCPCDQTFDYGRNNVLFGTFLTHDFGPPGGPDNDTDNVFSGSTNNPTNAASWAWWIIAGNAQRTNEVAAAQNNADQPWLLRNRGTTNANTDNVFVAYDDFSANPANVRVATSINNVPPQFPAGSDPVVGTSAAGTNPGSRLATDPRNGSVFALWENCNNNCGGDPKGIQYMLNRSTDQGTTWTLNGSNTGVVVATANSTQPTPKFGTVNALLGGVDHAAVDPTNGDLYYVYGDRDGAGNNRIAIKRITDNGMGGVTIPPDPGVIVAGGTVQAALPQVSVNNQGVVAVLYYTFNGIVTGFPQFTTWLATSNDHGATFSTQSILTFLATQNDACPQQPNQPDCTRQREFGDYVQMKSLSDCFYGSYVANRAAFGGMTAADDPVFFKACTLAHFSAFNAVLTEYPNVPMFSINANFTLAAGSNGINPPTEPVTLQIGNFTITIPPGSFSIPSPGYFTFVGVINGVSLEVVIRLTGPNHFIFGVIARNVNLTTINPPGPVGITLTIGDDSGTVGVAPIINNATP